jgi:putative membrane protein insertion efficiency factor
MKKLILFLIRLYQRYLSFDRGLFRFLLVADKACRFYPSCSEYSYQAVQKYGIIAGSLKSFKRIIKCHPLSQGGLDPLD